MSEVNQDQNQNTQSSEQKKYAGKFDTVEQLEEGYKNSAKVFQENENLKKQLETFTKAPDDYLRPDGVELQDNDLDEVKRLAKSAGLTQEHFNRLAKDWSARKQSKKQAFEEKIKALGEENLNVLKDYVAKHYPEKVADAVLDKLIKDDSAREAALKHREQLLNSTTPGLSKVNGGYGYSVTYNDVLKAREAHQSNKSNMKLRDNYLRLTAEYAKQQKQGA
jgi:hypothetical protein